MTTYTEDEIALARRGDIWLRGRVRVMDAYSASRSMRPRGADYNLATWALKKYGAKAAMDALFVALLDKCDAEGICVKMETASECIEVELIIEARRVGPAFHKNRALALLLALDAAGVLPKEDA